MRGRPAPASELHARLQAAPPGATGADGAAQAGVTAALTATLTALSAQIKALETQIAGQLAAHPDAHIFTSLPRPGTVRAARLLAEIGDCRSRFPDPESLAGLAGVAPVTRQSGTRIAHGFRWAVNRQLRDALCDFAADSRHASPWAAAIYDDARARGKDHPHAVRITARAWSLRHLALLARRHRLRPRQAQRPPGHPGPARRPGRQRRPAGGPVTAAIIAALRAHAAGLYPEEAGTELLIGHGGILHRDDFARFVHTGTSISDGTTLMAWIDWDAALSALHDGQIPVCGGEQRILQLAASIAEGFPVSLRASRPRPGQPEPETPDHGHPPRRRTTPPALASHHLSRPGRPPGRAC